VRARGQDTPRRIRITDSDPRCCCFLGKAPIATPSQSRFALRVLRAPPITFCIDMSSSSGPSHFRFNFGGQSLPLPASRPCDPSDVLEAQISFSPEQVLTGWFHSFNSTEIFPPLSRPQQPTQTRSRRLEIVLPANEGLTIYVACFPNCPE